MERIEAGPELEGPEGWVTEPGRFTGNSRLMERSGNEEPGAEILITPTRRTLSLASAMLIELFSSIQKMV